MGNRGFRYSRQILATRKENNASMRTEYTSRSISKSAWLKYVRIMDPFRFKNTCTPGLKTKNDIPTTID